MEKMTPEEKENLIQLAVPIIKSACDKAYDQAIDDAIKILMAHGLYRDNVVNALLSMKSKK